MQQVSFKAQYIYHIQSPGQQTNILFLITSLKKIVHFVNMQTAATFKLPAKISPIAKTLPSLDNKQFYFHLQTQINTITVTTLSFL
jgi:hypothetical protein